MRIIVSRAGYGKTTRISEYIRENQKIGKRSYVVVPEQFTLQTELSLMKQMDTSALIDVRVMSFERLSREILKKYGGYKRKFIDEVGKHMALRRVFEEQKDEIRMYRHAFRKEGFVSELTHTISELKKMSISGERLLREAESVSDELLQRKLYEIGTLYHAFEKYMDGHYIDNEDRIGLLAEMVDQGEYLKEIELFFDGFSGFTELELQVIDKLCGMGVMMNFALTYDPADRSGVFEKTAATFQKLCSIDEKYGKAYRIEALQEAPDADESLRFLERHLFDYHKKPMQEKVHSEAVSIYEALSVEDEIDHIAGEILRLVQTCGYRYQDILVVTSMPEIYTAKIRRTFLKYQIPHFVDEKRDLLGSALMEMIFSFLDMMIYDLSYESVFAFLKSGFSDLSGRELYLFENFCLKWGITGRRWHQKKFVEEEKYFLTVEEKEAVLAGWTYVLSFYQKYIEVFGKEQTARSYSETLFELLSELQVREKNAQLVRRLRDEGETDYANETVQLWNVLLGTMDQLVEILGDQKMTLKEYKLILQEGIHGQKIGVIPPTSDQIITATMDRSRSMPIKALFFLGVNEGSVPRNDGESPVFQEEDKKSLSERGIKLPSEMHNRSIEEDFILYSLLAKPTERLFLSYSLSDIEGKTLRHAPLIDRIRFLLPAVPVHGSFEQSDITKEILSPRWAMHRLTDKMRAYMENETIDSRWLRLYQWFQKNREESCQKESDAIKKGLFYQNGVKSLSKETAQALYEPLRVSATRMERFAACPFAHFLDYGLRPAERKVYEIDALELGTTFHTAMEKWGSVIEESEDSLLQDREACERIIDEIVEESLTESIRILMEHSPRNAYMLSKMKKVAKRAGWTMARHKLKGRFKLLGEEIAIRDKKISLSDKSEATLYAKVDRTDILEEEDRTYVKVIDYKSGEKSLELSDVYDGINIQLMLYLDLMMEEVQKKYPGKVLPAGAFYFYLSDERIATDSEDSEWIESEIEKELRMDGVILKDAKVLAAMDRDALQGRSSSVVRVGTDQGEPSGDNALTEEELRRVMSHVKKSLARRADRIHGGEIAVSPYWKKGKTPCQYCRYLSVCKFDQKLGDEYRRIRKKSAQEVLEKLERKDFDKGGE